MIPVLVGFTGRMPRLPRHENLPEDIGDLVEYQAYSLSRDRYSSDVADLTQKIIRVRRKARGTAGVSFPWRRLAAGAAAVGAILAGVYIGPTRPPPGTGSVEGRPKVVVAPLQGTDAATPDTEVGRNPTEGPSDEVEPLALLRKEQGNQPEEASKRKSPEDAERDREVAQPERLPLLQNARPRDWPSGPLDVLGVTLGMPIDVAISRVQKALSGIQVEAAVDTRSPCDIDAGFAMQTNKNRNAPEVIEEARQRFREKYAARG